MTTRDRIVALIVDRFRWWSDPPAPQRPSPALAGWSTAEWCRQAGIGEDPPHEPFRVQYPGRIVLANYDRIELAEQALRKMTLTDDVEPVAGRDKVWRARVKGSRP